MIESIAEIVGVVLVLIMIWLFVLILCQGGLKLSVIERRGLQGIQFVLINDPYQFEEPGIEDGVAEWR